jgi:polyribonucleotide nucleotidyltransferase
MSADDDHDPDVLGICGASMALMAAAAIPYEAALAGVRIGRLDGRFVVFPSYAEVAVNDLDLVVAGTDEAIVMVECGANHVTEQVVIDALELAHREIRRIIAVQREITAQLGIVKAPFEPEADPWPREFAEQAKARWTEPLRTALQVKGKLEQGAAVDAVKEQAIASLAEALAEEQTPWLKSLLRSLVKDITRETILDRKQRLDGRAFDEIRSVACEVGVLPRAGSALVTRGETQAMVTCTLGTSEDSQLIEAFEGESRQHFMLHYNFPPFSVGEVRFLRGPGRREIGHGALARRALGPILPDKETFPYTMRVVSDILESNGSSSMASVCGGSLALMDAGAPTSRAVAGIAMGLVSDGSASRS